MIKESCYHPLLGYITKFYENTSFEVDGVTYHPPQATKGNTSYERKRMFDLKEDNEFELASD